MAIGTQMMATIPHMTNGADGSIRIRRKEMAAAIDVPSVVGFSVIPDSLATPGLDLSPSEERLFPWLSGLAANYERFQFHNVKFELVSSNPTTVGGRIYMAVDYDYDDAVGLTAVSVMGNRTATQGPVWQSLSLSCDSRQLHPDVPWKYCSTLHRTSPEPRTAYSGFLIIAAAGLQSACHFDLWVEYDVTLQLPTSESFSGQIARGSVQGFADILPTDLTVTTGSGWNLGIVNDFVNRNASAVKQAVCGSPDCPVLEYTVSGGPGPVRPSVAWDLATALRGGVKSLIETWDVIGPGIAPKTQITSHGVVQDLRAFDAGGGYLGQVLNLAEGLGLTPGANFTDWTYNGKALRIVAGVELAKLVATYPAVRFLTHVLQGVYTGNLPVVVEPTVELV